jgi:hypothetical protein
MTQLHGVRPQQFFIDLQGLNPIDVYPDASNFEGSGVVTEHHFIAGLDTDEAVRCAQNLKKMLQLLLGQGGDVPAFGCIGGAVSEIFFEFTLTEFKRRAIAITGPDFDHVCSLRNF